ncbi:uncharacterized protein LOC118123542 isoform X2 [Hippoglossus stenolepis]|uniref:uncharacterized protein LOC118123542 isoform X2 n=1 Tax=Hippoglossus stenolepis TaxID=195615 RepID=UPI001FB017DD|nr:uncharacterized protein LOC118123542 isoform X2 [Hippoglossus stenolepis]
MDPGLVSRDDGRPSIPDTDAQSGTSGENPQGETKARAVIKRYYGVMDDEGADDVFIPPPPLPPSSSALLLPAEGSTGGMVNNSSVTHSTGATDATEDRANPSGLDWHHGERQSMAAQTKVDEVIATKTQTSEECMDATSLSNIEVLTPPTDEDQTSSEDTGCLMETCHETSGKESDEEAGDVVMWEETEEDICSLTETDSKPVKENVDCDRAETDVPTLPGLIGKDDGSEPSGPNTSQPQVPETPAEETDSDEEHVDTRSLSYKLTKSAWVRRESGSSETQVSQQPTSEVSEGTTTTKGETGDGSKRIATDIQQGEKLLQRLQLVQRRQDGQMMEVAQETRGKEPGEFETEVDPGEVNLTDGTEMEEKRIHSVVDEGAKGNVTEKEKSESKKERVSLSTMSDDAEEADDSHDDQSDRWEPADLSPIDPHENPNVSSQHRFSAAETSVEKQIQEENQAKQNLQRSGAVFNLTDNPDVLEIPFKTNILLEPLPSQVDQRSDWQFSEHKMQKEISQEIQRELVLVNQGKIPGGYSKEEIRKLEETKLLFEAFQQENPEGPTRLRKHPTTLIRGDANPSVLERTCSLERFSLERSLRLHESETSEKIEKSPEYLRSKSPTGGSRDKTRLSPYAKQDKHLRLCRSMDSISSDVSTSAAEARSKTREGRESPILQRNPFFKLRPALALQPEVEKDIRQAREREEELRRQRCTLYGEDRSSSQDEEKSGVTKTLVADVRKQSRGKLERVWPPPSRKDQQKSEQSQEPKVQRAGGQKAPLWQRWESGQINGEQPSQENT